jgi:hypothetical protein
MSGVLAMSLGKDWPTAELQEIFDEYGLRIIQRDRRRSGAAPWRTFLSPDGGPAYDPDATWTETHYTIRRNVLCESCGQLFGYSFEVDQISRVHRIGRSTDGALQRELSRQLRKRLRCSYCRAIQREPRRSLRRQDHLRSGLGCGLVLTGLLLVGGLGMMGAYLGGTVGFFLGLLAGLVLSLVLWYHAFPYLLSIRSAI